MLRGMIARLTQVGSSQDQGSHYFLLVIQPQPHARTGMPSQPLHWTSTYTPAEGATRFDVLQELTRQMVDEWPECDNGTVIAFDLARNELAPAVAAAPAKR